MPLKETPFNLMMQLVLADMESNYEQAAYCQRRLAEQGWHISKKSPEQESAKPRRPQKQATTATTLTS